MNELRQVFDRINIMVRRRRDEAYARSRVTHLGDPGIDLMAGKLAALARLRALRHFDLQIVGVDQVLAGHAETAGSDLLDRAAARIAIRVRLIARRVFATLAGV